MAFSSVSVAASSHAKLDGFDNAVKDIPTADTQEQPPVTSTQVAAVQAPESAKVRNRANVTDTSVDNLHSDKPKSDRSAEGEEWEIDSEDPNYTAGDVTITCCKCVIL